jgi:hypothetical protein
MTSLLFDDAEFLSPRVDEISVITPLNLINLINQTWSLVLRNKCLLFFRVSFTQDDE